MFKFILWLSIVFVTFHSSDVFSMENTSLRIEEVEGENDNNKLISFHKPLNKIEEREPKALRISSRMKFKLGFEFQEISGLCPWALNNNNVQKKSIFGFEAKANSRPLWKVVIDTNDIEFVTEPFTYKERAQVEIAIATLSYAFYTLQGLLNSQGRITFEDWVDKMGDTGIGSSDTPYGFRFFDTYSSVRNSFIIRPSPKWNPKFTPQVTIQHSLTHTIPLYFALFGFDNPYMFQFSASFPFRDEFLKKLSKAQKEANSEMMGDLVHGCQQKMNGLIFLHALTFVQMISDNDPDDKDLLEETYTNLTQYSQFDAKMKFTLMSRRPFSSMFKDIHTHGSYRAYFEAAMSLNNRFVKISPLFCKTNYAEQFCDPHTGNPKSLGHLLPLFRTDFVSQNQGTLTKLLDQGVVSTTMIRNFKENIKVDNSFPVSDLFNKYYEIAVKSVDLPEKTFIINENDGTIHSVSFKYDVLSPPCFLNFDNSMGRFKANLTEEESRYGEAIVEVRGIKDVQAWFLKKCKLDPELRGDFMTKPGTELKTQALCLFDFLKNFGTFQDIIEIFYLGMPYALDKY